MARKTPDYLERAGKAQTRADVAATTADRAWGRVRGEELWHDYRSRGGRVTNITEAQDRRETKAVKEVLDANR
ncbi:MAG TPA: hypothetical protein VEW42_03420 [Candidatus Eisenbacteria bacterium]|nr:hypothetical protein [Candidatus Eisenbacteria bacterium]